MTVLKPLITEFGIHYRLESCVAYNIQSSIPRISNFQPCLIVGVLTLFEQHKRGCLCEVITYCAWCVLLGSSLIGLRESQLCNYMMHNFAILLNQLPRSSNSEYSMSFLMALFR